MQFRTDIQGLRALAFLLVFIFHLNSSWLPGGFLGVDLFFVISGFLITGIAVNDIDKNKFSFRTFFVKRLKRIVPAYYFLLIFVAIAGTFIYLYTDLSNLRFELVGAAFFFSNYIFSLGDSYFGAKFSENPLLHTWSLAVEMQFYIILPIILVYLRKWLISILLGLIIILTLYSSYNIYYLDNKGEMYFSLLSRIPEFLIGSVYVLYFKNGIDINRKANNLISSISLVILLACSILITESSYFPGFLVLLPCLAGANLLVCKNNFIADFFSNKILVYIGELSYSLYLWHWPIMAFIRYKTDNYELSPINVLFVIILTFCCAAVSYYLIESKFKSFSIKKTLIFLLPTGFLFMLYTYKIKTIASVNKIPEQYARPSFGIKSHNTNIVEKFGTVSKNDSIVLIGDSHALIVKPFLDYIGKKYDFSYYTLTCDTFIALNGIDKKEIPNDKLKFFNFSRELVDQTKDLVKSSKTIYIGLSDISRLKSFESTIDSLATQLNPSQKIVVIESPRITKNPLKVNNNYLKTNSTKIDFINDSQNDAIWNRLTSKHSNIFVYRLSKSKLLRQPGYINDTVVFYDPGHMNSYGTTRLAKDLHSDFYNFLIENKIVTK